MNEGIGNLKRDMKTLKRKQMEILEKNTVKKNHLRALVADWTQRKKEFVTLKTVH